MSRFVNSESDFEGVEVGGKEGVNIDADKFMRILENAMGEVDEDGGGDLEGYFSDEDEGDSDDEEEESIKTVMKQMDDQVPRGEGENVDVDVDVVRNLIESVLGEEGEGGPASNLMKSLGVDFEEFRGT
ncbi:hypothetical protein TL16_g12997 [Triparma laevis f. inornata]|nr:hypothetical protein TL16_g12997 [Triparma laevis f. inornata]